MEKDLSLGIRKETDASYAERGLCTVYEMLVEALINPPDERICHDIAQVARTVGFDELEKTAKDAEDPSAAQRYYDRFFVPTSGTYIALSECRMADAEIEGGRVSFGPAANRRYEHVQALYDQAAFDFHNLKGDPLSLRQLAADSLASELAFLAFLAKAKEEDAIPRDAADRFLCAFLKNHGINWVENAARIMKAQSNDLYAQLVELAAFAQQAHADLIGLCSNTRRSSEI